jgi:hypothetical protein
VFFLCDDLVLTLTVAVDLDFESRLVFIDARIVAAAKVLSVPLMARGLGAFCARLIAFTGPRLRVRD